MVWARIVVNASHDPLDWRTRLHRSMGCSDLMAPESDLSGVESFRDPRRRSRRESPESYRCGVESHSTEARPLKTCPPLNRTVVVLKADPDGRAARHCAIP